jgi:hypothetical protein
MLLCCVAAAWKNARNRLLPLAWRVLLLLIVTPCEIIWLLASFWMHFVELQL